MLLCEGHALLLLAFVFEQMVLPHLKLLEIVDSTGIQKASLEVNSSFLHGQLQAVGSTT